MLERTYTLAEVKKNQRRSVITGAIAGAFGMVGLLVLIGETGGNYMRSELHKQDAQHETYRQQCEATANRALGATTLAENVLKGR